MPAAKSEFRPVRLGGPRTYNRPDRPALQTWWIPIRRHETTPPESWRCGSLQRWGQGLTRRQPRCNSLNHLVAPICGRPLRVRRWWGQMAAQEAFRGHVQLRSKRAPRAVSGATRLRGRPASQRCRRNRAGWAQ